MTDVQKKIIKKYIMDYDLENYSDDYLYKKFYKIPIKTYFEDIIDRFTFKITIDDIKEITKEIIENNTGVELTFTDRDWDNLSFEEIGNSWNKTPIRK